MSIKGHFNFYLSQYKGFKTNRKIVVIESDDWGSIRMPSKEAINNLQQLGINLSKNPYNLIDTLENIDDLNALYEIIDDKAFTHNKPKITFNFILANPDFDKIKKENWENYYYEKFTTTYHKRDGNNKVKDLIDYGIESKFIKPQFHGREHINALQWLEVLKTGNIDFKNAFNENCFCIDTIDNKNLLSAFEFNNKKEEIFIENSINEGIKLFKEAFNFSPKSAVAPRHVWNTKIEQVFYQNGIKQIQSSLNQIIPLNGFYKNIKHYTGEQNNLEQLYTVRNAYFEPAYNQSINWVNQVLSKAQTAFLFKTPLIISMHRLNFVGGINELNRFNNLNQFKQLISTLIKKYPDIEFMHSDELGKIIHNQYVRN
jgi:hypothetical protein